jgi:hypothetical protein
MKAARAYFYNVGLSVGKDSRKGCFQGKVHTLAAMARR